MDNEKIDLAVEAAKALISAATTLVLNEGWSRYRDRVAELWSSRRLTEEARDVSSAADRTRARRQAAADASDSSAESEWAARFASLLDRHPGAAADLRALIADTRPAASPGSVTQSMTGRFAFGDQVVMTGNSSYVKTRTALGVGATAMLLLVAVLVVWLVVRPDANPADPPEPKAGVSSPAGPSPNSCGPDLPARTEPPTAAFDSAVPESFMYKVTSAAGDGRDIEPGGYVQQAFVAARPFVSQVSAIVGVPNDRIHRIGFKIQRLDGSLILDETADQTAQNNNKDVVLNVAPPVAVTQREVLLFVVTNLSKERVRFFVDPPISNQVPVPFAACIVGQAQFPQKHPDLRSHILAGSITGRDIG